MRIGVVDYFAFVGVFSLCEPVLFISFGSVGLTGLGIIFGVLGATSVL